MPSSVVLEVIVAVLAALRRSMRPAVLMTRFGAVAVPVTLRMLALALLWFRINVPPVLALIVSRSRSWLALSVIVPWLPAAVTCMVP